MSPSIWQLLIVLVIVLLLFGGKRLANLGGDLGTAIKGFKKSMHDEEKDEKEEKEEEQSSTGRLQGSEQEDADFDRETERRESDHQR